jgi:hypothetical protein
MTLAIAIIASLVVGFAGGVILKSKLLAAEQAVVAREKAEIAKLRAKLVSLIGGQK